MGYYPVFLNMSGQHCIVIGGGAVAQRRVEGLLAASASVTVVSPAVTQPLAKLAAQGAIKYVTRAYEPGDLAGCNLAFIATDVGDVNQSVFSEACRRGVWINSADDPANCDFIVPSVVRRGDLSVAVSTGGASPALARAIREELETYFTADYARLVQVAGEVRQELKDKSRVVTADAWNQALKGELRELVTKNKMAEAKALLLKTLGADA
jgi:siroheme synthase-like protein